MRRTQDERKADTRERLLRAAADLFVARGVDAVSIDAIAEAAGRTSGAVYAHFGGKQALVLAVLDRWSSEAARAIAAAPAETLGDRMRSAWTAFTASDDAVRLLHELWLRAERDEQVRHALADRYRDSRAVMAETFEAWGASDPGATALYVYALLLGLDMQRRLDPSAVTDDAAVAGLQSAFGISRAVNPLPSKEHHHAHADL